MQHAVRITKERDREIQSGSERVPSPKPLQPEKESEREERWENKSEKEEADQNDRS